MKKSIIIILFSFIVLVCYSQTKSKGKFNFPNYIAYVNDFEGILTKTQIVELNQIISKHEKETTNEIAVATIKSFDPYETLFDYSLDLANYWGIGKKGKNNGVTIVLGKQIRQIRIQVGYGLEDKLKDEEVKYIIDNTIIPEFKKGDFFNGLKSGLVEIIKEIK